MAEAVPFPQPFFLSGLGLAFNARDGLFCGPFFVYAYIFGFGLDWLAHFVFFVFIFLEIFSAPGIFAQRGFACGAGIDDHARFDGGARN